MLHRTSRLHVVAGVVIAVTTSAVVAAASLAGAAPTTSQRSAAAHSAFGDNSYWNTPLPPNAPKHPNNSGILRYLSHAPEANNGCIRLAGAKQDRWGMPIYWSGRRDPEYKVTSTAYGLPPELRNLRIPKGARPAKTSDATMTVYDVRRGYVVTMWHAHFQRSSRTWTAGGAQIAYLHSNGLDADLRASNDRRNIGSLRGNNGATNAVRFAEVRAGAIRHVLKISSGPEVSSRSVLPIVRSDGTSTNGNAPAQGTRLRIKPSVNLSVIKNRQARIIARAMQRYGVYIGDSSSSTALKLEDTRAQGIGQKWTMNPQALCRLPIGRKYWKVVPYGYHHG